MTTHYKTKAFVFRKNDVNESDRFFSVFSSDFGRLDIFAKAIRKSASKLRSGMDVFLMSDIEFIQGKNRKTLVDAVTLERFGNIKIYPEKFKTANVISGILDNFIKGQEKDEKIFDLIEETFIKLNSQHSTFVAQQLIYPYFLWNFLSLLGYKPEVDNCSICRIKLNPYSIYFSYKLGGIVCRKCLDHDNLSIEANSDIVKILRLILKKDWQILSKLKVDPGSKKMLHKVSDSYVHYILSSHSFENGVIINTI